jgi:hypothetical protein
MAPERGQYSRCEGNGLPGGKNQAPGYPQFDGKQVSCRPELYGAVGSQENWNRKAPNGNKKERYMRKNLALATILVIAAAIGAKAADITGKWVADVPGRNGTTQMTFELKADGKKLTGTVSGLTGAGGGRRGGASADPSAPTDRQISDGKVDGAKVSFSVKIDRNGQTMVTTYKGTFTDDQLKLKQTREGRNGDQTTDIVAARSSN